MEEKNGTYSKKQSGSGKSVGVGGSTGGGGGRGWGSGKSGSMVSGTINTQTINNTHTQMKEIVESYKNLTMRVHQITDDVRRNWVGEGRNEFETQYTILICKIEDFDSTLQEMYKALVDAEQAYEDKDDELRQSFVTAKS